jgi:hypothetical protein
MRRTRVTGGLAAVGCVTADRDPRRLRGIRPRSRVRPVRLAKAGIAAERLERRPQQRRDARLPAGWTAIKTDPGTASVALFGGGGRIDGYLNATPGQGTETLPDWSRFRPQHNQSEGDRSERLVTATTEARFRSGRGACVIDTYTTSRASYREIACLRLWPELELCGRRRRPHRALGPTGRHAATSRVELRRMSP